MVSLVQIMHLHHYRELFCRRSLLRQIPGLGIRCVSWHPSGSFIAIGGYDDKIYILDSLSWSSVTTLELTSKIASGVVRVSFLVSPILGRIFLTRRFGH